ncbi:MAG TPA: hypothetical protein VGH80_15385 [Xanthomonadaceae bacterium]|jgi:hypothetical protein
MDADSYWGQISDPLVYRVRPIYRLCLYGFALLEGFFLLFPLVSSALAGPVHGYGDFASGVLFTLLVAWLTLFCALYPTRAFVRITSDAIEHRWVFATESMRRDEVTGRKRFYAKKGGREYYKLVSRSGRELRIDDGALNVDDAFDAWLGSIPEIEEHHRLCAERYKGF